MGADVFIIHASTDRAFARRLVEALGRHTVSTFLDAIDVEPGQPWDARIAAGLRDALVWAVLIGKEDRHYQHEEIDLALRRMRETGPDDRILPILLEPRDELPYGLNRLQAIGWDGGPEPVAAALAARVAKLRGRDLAARGGARARVAVAGVRDELGDVLDRLQLRLGQRSAILDGAVAVVDLAAEPLPPVDLLVAVIGSRHAGKLDVMRELIARAAGEADAIVGALEISLRKVAPEHRDEARAVSELTPAIVADSSALLIDELAEAFDRWHEARAPRGPGLSRLRERWEEQYLQAKAGLWARGEGGAPYALGRRPDRTRWYVHLKAAQPWVAVAGEVRYQVPVRYEPVHDRLAHVHEDVDEDAGTVPPRELWWAGPFEPGDVPETESPTFRNAHLPATGAWMDPIVSHGALPRCVVVGFAGAGKSVLLEHLAWVLAMDDARLPGGAVGEPAHRVDREGVRGESPIAPIPILHTATTVVSHLRGRGTRRPIREALVELLRSSDTFGDHADAELLRAGLDAGRYVFLIDSLDEVRLQEDRQALVDALGSLAEAAPRLRVVLTTRPTIETETELPRGFVRVDLAPLDEATMRQVTRAWVAAWAPRRDEAAVIRAVERVRREFPTTQDERSPVENPLLLGIVLHVYVSYGQLPDDVATLYSDMVSALCKRRSVGSDEDERETMADRFRDALRDIFLACQERGGTRIPLADVRELLVRRKHARREHVDGWLRRLANHTGLIRFETAREQTSVRPWHRSYQEYLAAAGLVVRFANRSAECVAWLRTAGDAAKVAPIDDGAWRGTLRFLVGAAIHADRTFGVALVEELARAADAGGADQARLYALAASAAAEYPRVFEAEPVRDRLRMNIATRFEASGEAWPLEPRIEALDALGRLGDPRLPDPRTIESFDPEHGWCYVPPGKYFVRWRGLTANAVRLLEALHPLRDTPGFWIRRWPVTVAEFGAFAKAVGQGSWWDEQARRPTHPVQDVDWFTARAFCAWAQQHWRLPATTADLPTSSEWEIAVRRQSTAVVTPVLDLGNARLPVWMFWHSVTSYPVGARIDARTAAGLWDGGVNVWEWTSDHSLGPIGTDTESNLVLGEHAIVCRGGQRKMLSEDDLALEPPSSRRRLLGFRVVCR